MATLTEVLRTYLAPVLVITTGFLIYVGLGEPAWGTAVIAFGIGTLMDLSGGSGGSPVVLPGKHR